MKRILSLILCVSMLLCSLPVLTVSSAGEGSDSGLHSISELNTDEVHPDSHSGETQQSTLELDYRRSYKIDNEEMIDKGDMWYPRVKKLSSGGYILFFQDGRWGPNVYYTRSDDGLSWDEPTLLFASHLTYNDTYLRNYATCDAIELSNGDILVAAIFQPTARIQTHLPQAVGSQQKEVSLQSSQRTAEILGRISRPYITEDAGSRAFSSFPTARYRCILLTAGRRMQYTALLWEVTYQAALLCLPPPTEDIAGRLWL